MEKLNKPVVPEGRRLNRRGSLERALKKASTGPDILAAAADYFRSVFHRVPAAKALEVSRKLIEMTDQEAGEKR